MINQFSILGAMMLSTAITAQVELDKPLQLTGTGADAKIEGIQSITLPQDAVSAEAVQKSSLTYDDSAGGATDAYTASLSPSPAALNAGLLVMFKANANNTGAATLNVNGLGDIPLKKDAGDDLAADDIKAGQIVAAIYDGTNFQLVSGTGSSGGGGGTMDYTHMYLDTFH